MIYLAIESYSSDLKRCRWYRIGVNKVIRSNDKVDSLFIDHEVLYKANSIINLSDRIWLKRRSCNATEIEPGFIECLMEFPLTPLMEFYDIMNLRRAFTRSPINAP